MAENILINGTTYPGVESVELNTTDGKKVLYFEGQPVTIVQTTGDSETAVMSQRAVTDALANLDHGGAIEPEADDIPKVYFVGVLPVSKADGELKGKLRYKSKTGEFSLHATLKVQGDSSVHYPKKNFTLKMFEDSECEIKAKKNLKGWGEMSKFVLKAHWMDHSHVRNVGTAKLWGQVVRSRADFDSLPEELRTAPNCGATDGFTVKFFANGIYQGLYEWIVPKDKLFGQDSDIATHSILNSEYNNQPTCAFATTTPIIGGNWSEELQDSLSPSISTSFANAIRFVAESTDAEFLANAENYFDVQSVIDYDIFARIFCIVDNLCKNQIFFTYDGTKWYEGAWDLDAVLGLPPTVRGFFAYNTEFQSGYVAYTDYGVTNRLYQRVETVFQERFKARYEELRQGVLAVDNIIDVYERLTDAITTYDGLLAEDYAETTANGAFTGIPFTAENTIQQIREFVVRRLSYMDDVIANSPGDLEPINILDGVAWNSGYINASGVIGSSSQDAYTDAFDISAYKGKTFAVVLRGGVPAFKNSCRLNFYDSGGTFISYVGNTSIEMCIVCDKVPDNAKTARITCNVSAGLNNVSIVYMEKVVTSESLENIEHYEGKYFDLETSTLKSENGEPKTLKCYKVPVSAGETWLFAEAFSGILFKNDSSTIVIKPFSTPGKDFITDFAASGYAGVNIKIDYTGIFCFKLGKEIGSIAYPA